MPHSGEERYTRVMASTKGGSGSGYLLAKRSELKVPAQGPALLSEQVTGAELRSH